MICQSEGRALRRNLAVRFLIGASAATAFLWSFAPLSASADPEPTQTEITDISHGGNGTNNHNSFSVKSPTNNHGYQHTSSSTEGGVTSIQNAMCKNVKVCHITQNFSPVAETVTPHETETLIAKKAGESSAEEAGRPAPGNVSALFPLYPLGLMGTVSAAAIPPSPGVAGRAAPDAGQRAPRLSADAGNRPTGFVHRRGHRVRSGRALG
jgi:hypothetical protein